MRAPAPAKESPKVLKNYQTQDTAADERDLTLEGFVTFSDPPRPDAKDAILAMRRDGVDVKVITGDDAAVARHVVAAIGIEPGDVLTGAEIERMTDGALGHVAERHPEMMKKEIWAIQKATALFSWQATARRRPNPMGFVAQV